MAEENKVDQGNEAEKVVTPPLSTDGQDQEKEAPKAEEKQPEKVAEAKGEEAKDSKTEDEEPAVRKSKLDYILERKQRKIEKLEREKAEATGDKNKSEDEDLSPEEESKIAKVIERRYGQQFEKADEIAEENAKAAVSKEVDEFIEKDPNGKYFKEFKDKITKWALHPSRAKMPITAIAYEIAGPELLKLGAKMAKEADEEALDSKTGGGTARNLDTSGKKDIWGLSSKDFAARQQEVLQRQRSV